ncbi:hypothetical protein AADZ90_013005 [Aestuariibius sp. 2305UL40-4]|uniref:hypothetical protein n=1 Tax=Aestuariibius violaceus TaxID=3234132 RepID=UPI00345E5C37
MDRARRTDLYFADYARGEAHPDEVTHGAGPVDRLGQLEARVIRDMRQWSEGVPGQIPVWESYRAAIGDTAAAETVATLDALIEIVGEAACRPLKRYRVGCACAGVDEANFAHTVALASDGHRREAVMIAALIVTASRAHQIALLAGSYGHALRRILAAEGAQRRRKLH